MRHGEGADHVRYGALVRLTELDLRIDRERRMVRAADQTGQVPRRQKLKARLDSFDCQGHRIAQQDAGSGVERVVRIDRSSVRENIIAARQLSLPSRQDGISPSTVSKIWLACPKGLSVGLQNSRCRCPACSGRVVN